MTTSSSALEPAYGDNGQVARGGCRWEWMPTRLVRLRYAATCARCGTALVPGDHGWWNAETRNASCETCGQDGAVAVLQPHPRIAKLILAASPEPAHVDAWAKGALGERQVGARLDQLRSSGAIVLHDRRIPGSRANIDHIVIARSGVWVVDTKRHRGRVDRRDVGGWLRRDLRLVVGGHDRTKLVDGLASQHGAVRLAVADPEVMLRPVLCFVDAEWAPFARPFDVEGVLVMWPRALVNTINGAPDRGLPVLELAGRIARALPTASR